jgi:hypothetical protein
MTHNAVDAESSALDTHDRETGSTRTSSSPDILAVVCTLQNLLSATDSQESTVDRASAEFQPLLKQATRNEALRFPLTSPSNRRKQCAANEKITSSLVRGLHSFPTSLTHSNLPILTLLLKFAMSVFAGAEGSGHAAMYFDSLSI